jgi:uncharacterized membrane protein
MIFRIHFKERTVGKIIYKFAMIFLKIFTYLPHMAVFLSHLTYEIKTFWLTQDIHIFFYRTVI